MMLFGTLFFAARHPAGIDMCPSAVLAMSSLMAWNPCLRGPALPLRSAVLACCKLGSLQKLEAQAVRSFFFL